MDQRRAVWLVLPVLLIITLFTLFACCCPGNRPRTVAVALSETPAIGQANLPGPTEAVRAGETDAAMNSVNFHIDPTAVLHIHDLRGQMFDKEKGKPLNFANKQSFIVRMFRAHIGVIGPTLTDLMNRYVFN